MRLVFVKEDAPESALPVPDDEWRAERHPDKIAEMLNESAAAVRHAVKGRIETGRAIELHYDYPILMLQHISGTKAITTAR